MHNTTDIHTTPSTTADISPYCDNRKTQRQTDLTPTGETVLTSINGTEVFVRLFRFLECDLDTVEVSRLLFPLEITYIPTYVYNRHNSRVL